jgi:hypothetical protein
VALLGQLELKDVTVIGNSIGGWIAAEMALLASPRVSSAILVDAVGIEVPGHPVADFFSLTMDQVFALSFHNPGPFRVDPATLPPAAQAIAAGNRAALATYAGTAMSDPTLAGRLARLELPTVVLWGDSDQIADPDYGRAYAAAIPLARFPAPGRHRPPAATRNPPAADERDLEQRRHRLLRPSRPRTQLGGKARHHASRRGAPVTRITRSCHLIEIGGRTLPTPRPMMAVLDANPRQAGPLRALILELAAQVHREPGCRFRTGRMRKRVPAAEAETERPVIFAHEHGKAAITTRPERRILAHWARAGTRH